MLKKLFTITTLVALLVSMFSPFVGAASKAATLPKGIEKNNTGKRVKGQEGGDDMLETLTHFPPIERIVLLRKQLQDEATGTGLDKEEKTGINKYL